MSSKNPSTDGLPVHSPPQLPAGKFDHGTGSHVDPGSLDSKVGGVRNAEAAYKVYGRISKWFLFVGLGLSAYIYSLDGATTWSYLAFSTSTFENHSLIASIQTAQSIIIAVGKPVIAKLSDVTSRPFAYVITIVSYVIGYVILASARSVGILAGGIIFYAVGYTGLQILNQIVIADITTLKWRGLVSGLIYSPFIINAFVGSRISASILENSTWRWGYGMFAILLPVTLAPLVGTLIYGELEAKKVGLIAQPRHQGGRSFAQKVITFAEQIDLIGLVLLGSAVTLILLPITLVKTAGQWNDGNIVAMIVTGCVLLVMFLVYDIKFAQVPIISKQFIKNKAIVAASWIGFLDFVSFYITFAYLYSFVIVVKPWSLTNANYFVQTQTVGLTVFGVCAGVILRITRRYKWLLVAGLLIRLLGVGIMIRSRGVDGSDAEIVISQIIQSIGGGIASTATQVAAQGSVPHSGVAMATAIVLLWTEIGGAVGNAIAGGIWRNLMPNNLAKSLPFLDEATRAELFGSISLAAKYPLGDPIRTGVIQAYSETMKVMTIVATVVAAFPPIFALFLPDLYLGDKQNAVDNTDLSGETAQASS